MRTPSTEPSLKQLDLFRHIIKHIEEHGYQPSLHEMAHAFKISKNAVVGRINGLKRLGYLATPDDEVARERCLIIPNVRFRAYSIAKGT